MDIGIKWGKRTDSAFILPKTSNNAEKERLCAQYGAVFHFEKRLPLYGNGEKQYFALTAEYFDGTAFFVNADDMRSAKSIMKDVLTNMGKEDKVHSSSICIVKGSKYTAEVSPLPQKKLTIEHAIKRYEKMAENDESIVRMTGKANAPNCVKRAAEYRQIIALFRELQERRKAPEIITCGECAYKYVDCGNNACELNHNYAQSDDFFCGDAKRRTDG